MEADDPRVSFLCEGCLFLFELRVVSSLVYMFPFLEHSFAFS